MEISQRSRIGAIIVISALLTLASYQIVQNYVTEQAQREVQQQQPKLIDVLVSRRELVAGEIVDANILVKRSYPEQLVQDSWLRPEDAEMIIGLATTRFLEQGEPFTPDVLIPLRENGFSVTLTPGSYAVTSAISKQQLHNGLIQVGDKVTLVAESFTADSEQLMLSNIEILALDNFNHQSQLEMTATHYLPSTVTFGFTHQQAQTFELMRRQSFAVWLQHPQHNYAHATRVEPIRIHRFKGNGGSNYAAYN